jgi:UDP-N-acetylglucosamine acyltransferase
VRVVNRIHPTAVIGSDVELGDGNVVGPYAVVLGPATIGDDNWIGPHVVIGTPGEVRGIPHGAAWEAPPPPGGAGGAPAGSGEGSTVGGIVIGDRNVIREFTTVQAPFVEETRIGDDCYLMTKSHLPHDGVLGDRVTVACSVMIGGHGRIGDGANLGLGSVLHQFLVVGPGAMVGMGSVVTRPVAPYAMAYGSPARVRGVNRVGMERAGVPAAAIEDLAAAYADDGAAGDVTPPEPLAEAFRWYEAARRAVSH